MEPNEQSLVRPNHHLCLAISLPSSGPSWGVSNRYLLRQKTKRLYFSLRHKKKLGLRLKPNVDIKPTSFQTRVEGGVRLKTRIQQLKGACAANDGLGVEKADTIFKWMLKSYETAKDQSERMTKKNLKMTQKHEEDIQNQDVKIEYNKIANDFIDCNQTIDQEADFLIEGWYKLFNYPYVNAFTRFDPI